jgi:hypothetical protein
LLFQWIGMVESILCYCGPAEHWDPPPTTRKASRKILIGQNIKKPTGQHSVYSVVCTTSPWLGYTGCTVHNALSLMTNVRYSTVSYAWECPLKSSYRSLCCINLDDDIEKNWLIYIVLRALGMEEREKVIQYRDSLVRPQSTQSAGPVRFLIFCSISFILLAGRRPQCTAGAD